MISDKKSKLRKGFNAREMIKGIYDTFLTNIQLELFTNG